MSQYHHELENFPDWIGYFYTDGSGDWNCDPCRENDGFWVLGNSGAGDWDLVDILRALEKHVEEKHL